MAPYKRSKKVSCRLRAFGQFITIQVRTNPTLIRSQVRVANGATTEKISMAPALRMTRSIKEKLNIF
ncbi:hypothetical protein HDV63DRAFT_364029, partial [Trichoderma sp. SZMC 28014]